MDELVAGIIEDPLEQADKFAYIGGRVKQRGLNIWCYSGYTFEYIIENRNKKKGWNDLLGVIDVLVDGKFEMDNKRENLKYRGSANQRIIDVRASLAGKQIKLLDID